MQVLIETRFAILDSSLEPQMSPGSYDHAIISYDHSII